MRLVTYELLQGPRRGWGWGGFSPPTFLAVDVRTLNVQLEIFKQTENVATLDDDTNKI